MINENFRALLDESAFTREILLSGLTQIRKANYAKKGAYFQSFTSLSTGIERLGKLCLIIDYYIDNNGQFPSLSYLKNEIGHDLLMLYSNSKNISRRRDLQFKYLDNLDGSFHQSILSIFTKFAKGDRYSNIDFIATQNRRSDPISEWWDKVDKVIFTENVTSRKKASILSNAKIADDCLRDAGFIRYISESGFVLGDFKSASFLAGMTSAVVPFRQLYIAQIIRYWVEIISDLQIKAADVGKQDIPFFNELFAEFYNDDNILKQTKDLSK